MKTFDQCKIEVAKKYGFGKLVMGHLVKYYDEAAELYADQYRNNKRDEMMIRLALLEASLWEKGLTDEEMTLISYQDARLRMIERLLEKYKNKILKQTP